MTRPTHPPPPRHARCRIHEGHKTGFCLMDSYCGDQPEDPLKLKYICRFQGITASCMDAYGGCAAPHLQRKRAGVCSQCCMMCSARRITAGWQRACCMSGRTLDTQPAAHAAALSCNTGAAG
jgi:hypothetical protein